MPTLRAKNAMCLLLLMKYFLCTAASSGEPRVSSPYKGHYYQFANKQNAKDAEIICRRMGGYLAEIDDLDEMRFITKFMNEFPLDTYTYIGGRDDQVDGNWYFPRTNQPMSFSYWAPVEPNNWGGNEDCNSLEYQKGEVFMNDVSCSLPRYVLCEVPFIF